MTGEDITENVEEEYVKWIFSAFERYKNCPPEGVGSLDDIARYITKEFNIRKFLYETSNNKSIDNLTQIFSMNIDEKLKKEAIEKNEEQTPDNEKWVSENLIFELLSCLEKVVPSTDVVVMHPETNGAKENERSR